MDKNYEIINFDIGMPLRCRMHQFGYVESHTHAYFEIDLVLSGTCTAIVEGKTYHLRTDDVISIDPHVSHEFRASECVLICVQFDQSAFVQMLPEPTHPLFFCNSAVQGDNAAFGRIRTLIAQLVKNSADQQQGYELRNCACVFELMDVLYNNFRITRSHAQDAQDHRYSVRIAQIARLIQEHHTESLSLSRLAEMVHLSAPYLSKFFDQQFGMTFLSYLTQVRLNHAVNDLLATDKIMEDVAADSGFPNSHAFVQAFKKEYGILPSVYRRQNRAKKAEKQVAPRSFPAVEHHDYMVGLKKYLTPAPVAPAVPANSISCNVRLSANAEGRKLKHSWRNVMGVGTASDLLTADVQAMVRRMQEEIGFQFIKFNGILSDDLHVYSENSAGLPVYNFVYVDKILDFLMSIGLRPMIQLSFMPALLAKNPSRKLFNYLVSEPKSLQGWKDLISALMGHLLCRYGIDEVSKWHFCVWTQPDTPEELYGFSSTEAFYAFYQDTYQAVKDLDSRLSFGAPPTYYIVEENYTNWYIPFLEWCKRNHCFPDFLNFNYYDTTLAKKPLSKDSIFGFVFSMTLRDTPDGFRSFVDQALFEREKMGLRRMPIYLTEWNNTPSQEDLLNDTCFKSCYIVKNILENYDRLDSFGYWSLTDWMGEAPLPKELFFGGLGLFTVNGIPKASYYALWLLRQLGNEFVGSGDGWFATRQGNRQIILLYNYRHFSHLYSLGERFDMTFTDRYTPFDPVQAMDVHLSITDVADGRYLVRETILNRKSGSVFDQWVEMGALEPDTEQEIKTLAARSTPSCSKYITEAKNHTLEIDAMLDMLEARLITIAPAGERK